MLTAALLWEMTGCAAVEWEWETDASRGETLICPMNGWYYLLICECSIDYQEWCPMIEAAEIFTLKTGPNVEQVHDTSPHRHKTWSRRQNAPRLWLVLSTFTSHFHLKTRSDITDRTGICITNTTGAFLFHAFKWPSYRLLVIELAMLPELWRIAPVSDWLSGLIVCLIKCNCKRQAGEIQQVIREKALLFSSEFPSFFIAWQYEGGRKKNGRTMYISTPHRVYCQGELLWIAFSCARAGGRTGGRGWNEYPLFFSSGATFSGEQCHRSSSSQSLLTE